MYGRLHCQCCCEILILIWIWSRQKTQVHVMYLFLSTHVIQFDIIIILLNLSCSSDCSSEIKKCTGEYLAALKSNKHSSGANQQYLPRCASDGSYSPTQCHYSIGYCWCVDVDTGKPIPDTTRKSTSLDCWKYSK